MRRIAQDEVPQDIEQTPAAELRSLRRLTCGADFLSAERHYAAGFVALPSLWLSEDNELSARCSCAESLDGWCVHTRALAASWMDDPGPFVSADDAPTTPLGTLEPARRRSPALERFLSFIQAAVGEGLAKAPVSGQLAAIAGELREEGLDRAANWLRLASERCAALGEESPPADSAAAQEALLDAVRKATFLQELMARDRLPEAVHDEWLGSLLDIPTSMPVRRRRLLEVGRGRYVGGDGETTLKRYWVDLETGEAFTDEQPEADRVGLEEEAQVLRVRRGEIHPGFAPRWLELLAGGEEEADEDAVEAALQRFTPGVRGLTKAVRARRRLEGAPEDWVGGVAGMLLTVGDDGRLRLVDQGDESTLPLGGEWPPAEGDYDEVEGLYGRVVVQPGGPTVYPLALLGGGKVRLAPADFPFPHSRLLDVADEAPHAKPLLALLEALHGGLGTKKALGELLDALTPLVSDFKAKSGKSAHELRDAEAPLTASDLATLWSVVREQLLP